MIADQDEPATVGDSFAEPDIGFKPEDIAEIFEGLVAGHVGDVVGELDRLGIAQQCVEEGAA